MFLSVLLVYIVVPILCVWTLRNAFVGICTYYFWSFYRPKDIYFYSIGQEGARFTRYIAIVTIVSFIVHHKKYTNFFRSLWYPLQNRLMLFYFIFLCISQMVSIAPEFSRYAFDIISKLLLMYFLATAIVNDEKKIRIVMEVYMFSFILLAWWATGKYYFEGIMNIEDALAYSGSYSDRNFFAMLFVMSLPFCILYPFTIKKNITRYIVWFFAPIMMNVIYITASRGGFLGMVMSGLASGIKIKSKKIMLVALIIGIVLGIRLMGQRAGDRIKTIFVEEGERDAAATSRKDAWKRAINCSVENPLGIGPYCFQLYKSAGFGGAPAAHNFYLQVAAEQGIASALILVFLILLSFWDLGVIIRISKNDSRLINYYYYASMITASLCGFVLSSVFLSLSMFEPFYFLVAMTVILKNVLLKELSK